MASTLIIGAGAVGLGIGTCLAASTDWPLVYLTRPDGAAAILENGISRSGIFGGVQVKPDRISAADSPDKIQSGPFDLVLVCTKSFDSVTAAATLAENPELIDSNSIIVLFHNGWGSADPFVERFPRRQIFNARVITGFKRLGRSSVEITVHADDIRIGSVFYPDSLDQVRPLAQAIDGGGIPAQVTTTVGRDIWTKMLYNCALNPLGAILNASYGALGDSAHSREIMNTIIDEAFAVMQACGHSTHFETAEDFKQAFYCKMIPPTYVHESSMLQDIRAGRKTEIDFLSGAIVRLGKSRGIEAPANQLVVSQIGFIEAAGRI